MNISHGELPVTGDADVLALLPAFMRSGDAAPVRDALVAAIRAILMTYQDAATYAAAQSDILTATGPYLRSKLEERGIYQLAGESDEDYRARGLGFQQVVTPAAIVAAVNSIISPLTCTYLEPSLDRLFLSDGTAPWHSFIGARPSYPDRLGADDSVVNGGVIRPSYDPGAGFMFTTSDGRYFVLRVPDLSSFDQTIQMVYSGTKLASSDATVPELGGATPPLTATLAAGEVSSALGGNGIYLYTGATDPDARTYVYANTTSSSLAYARIVSTVDRLRGASFRWALYSST